MVLTLGLTVNLIGLLCTVYGAVTISPKNEFPLKGQSFTLTCKSDITGNNINWAVGTGGSASVLTGCVASSDNGCFPTASGYTFTSDVSANTFFMQIDSVALSNCDTYTCIDASTADSDLVQLKISDINTDLTSLTVSEPAVKTAGQVSIETACLTPLTAVTAQRCTYYSKNGQEVENCENETITSSSTGCTDTCNGEGWVKVTVLYQYAQATINPVDGNLRVRIKHTGDSNNPKEIVWNSSNIQLVESNEASESYLTIAIVIFIIESLGNIGVIIPTSLIRCGMILPDIRQSYEQLILLGVECGSLIWTLVAGPIHMHTNKVGDGEKTPWYVIVSIILTCIAVVAFVVYIIVVKCGANKKCTPDKEIPKEN